ncbi:MAG: DUF814 domain-containing protein [Planctomycetes bacterium]|nr:DUF814 domain-containing protein [Planctomycetota bacterium]
MDAPAALNATELTALLAELEARWSAAIVDGVALVKDRDDLLLFLVHDERRQVLQVAPGGRRARVCTTARRFPAHRFASGPRVDRLAELLGGATVVRCSAPSAGERRALLELRTGSGEPRRLHVELFGTRGLWALTDADDVILALSRLPNVAARALRPGARYEPPAAPPRTAPPGVETDRFATAPSRLDAVDGLFSALDHAEEDRAEEDLLARALQRARARIDGRLQGARAQLQAAEGARDIRTAADMLLAYGSTLPADATELRCPHPERPDEQLVVPRETRLKPHAQAEMLYRKARKHEDGRRAAEERIAELTGEVEALASLETRFAALPGEARARGLALAELHDAFAARGLVEPRRPARPDQRELKLRKLTGGENFRRFVTREGLLVLVGRDNQQNDRLTTRVARGSDLWFHVGRGYAGSHVLLRVDKGRNASLESLLDAATLALHFSKVRGTELGEVIYCPAKQVRKPKGLPPGAVVPSRTRTLHVRREPDRLERLLSSSQDGEKL